MATWHQQQRAVKLYHDTQWVVVDDPPNDCRSVMRFDTEAAARAYVDCRIALGTGDNCYVLAPQRQP